MGFRIIARATPHTISLVMEKHLSCSFVVNKNGKNPLYGERVTEARTPWPVVSGSFSFCMVAGDSLPGQGQPWWLRGSLGRRSLIKHATKRKVAKGYLEQEISQRRPKARQDSIDHQDCSPKPRTPTRLETYNTVQCYLSPRTKWITR